MRTSILALFVGCLMTLLACGGTGSVTDTDSAGGATSTSSATSTGGGGNGGAATTSTTTTATATDGSTESALPEPCKTFKEGHPPTYEGADAMEIGETIVPLNLAVRRWVNVDGTCYLETVGVSTKPADTAPGTTFYYQANGSSAPNAEIDLFPKKKDGLVVDPMPWYFNCPGNDDTNTVLAGSDWMSFTPATMLGHYVVPANDTPCGANKTYFLAGVFPAP